MLYFFCCPVAGRCCFQAAYGSQLPFPLSYIVPWSQRNEMARLLGHIDGFKVGRVGGERRSRCAVLALRPAVLVMPAAG